MFRRTKIVATLGPATDNANVLEDLILAGVNVVRINFSHGSADDHRKRVMDVRELAAKHKRFVAVLGDLQGPKIRIARFAHGAIALAKGDDFVLDASLPVDVGDQQQVGIDYKELPQDVSAGDLLLLDDGRVVLQVKAIEGSRILCRVNVGGTLSNNKGINRQGGGLSAPALTDKDKQDIHLAVALDVDYLAVSFPRYAEDMHNARELVKQAGGDIALVAKIERAESVETDEILDELIKASDAVMVARGDLGVEIGDAQLMAVQKQVIARARALNRCVITATQMMETMITSSLPTRAEVFDVANAVLDGTDAVMLSAETATGQYPVQTVEAMVRIIIGAEKHPQSYSSHIAAEDGCQSVDQAIALSAMYASLQLQGISAIACMTETGATPLLMSRFGAKQPIFAFSAHTKTLSRVALYRGVNPVHFDSHNTPYEETNRRVITELQEQDVVQDDDYVILSKGDHANVKGGTNTLKILTVGQNIL